MRNPALDLSGSTGMGGDAWRRRFCGAHGCREGVRMACRCSLLNERCRVDVGEIRNDRPRSEWRRLRRQRRFPIGFSSFPVNVSKYFSHLDEFFAVISSACAYVRSVMTMTTETVRKTDANNRSTRNKHTHKYVNNFGSIVPRYRVMGCRS